MKIVFMGSPDFAVASLEACRAAGHQILAVVTAPDKLGGRGHTQWIQSAVKQYAMTHDLMLLQPEKLRDPGFLQEISELQADLFVVVAFRMMPEVLWHIPRLGSINVHGSLLPKYRGAAPINWAIIRGETETGVSSFLISKDIDTGAILDQAKIEILPEDNFATLYEKMKILGASLLIETLKKLESGSASPKPQSNELASSAPKINLETGHIDFHDKARNIHNLIRGLSPYPAAWFTLNGQIIKIFESEYVIEPHTKKAGTLEKADKKTLKIYTPDGAILPILIQPEGKRKMKIEDFLNGWNKEGLTGQQ